MMFLRVPNQDINPLHTSDLLRVTIDIAASHHNAGIRILPDSTSDNIPTAGISSMGNCTGIDDEEVGFFTIPDPPEPTRIQISGHLLSLILIQSTSDCPQGELFEFGLLHLG